MKKMSKALLITLLLFTLGSCGNVPTTDELDKDIAELTKAIKATENEVKKYSEGLLKTLLELNKDILTNTKLMLEQKRSGFKRFIPIKYNIDGKKYLPPNNKEDLLKTIQDEIINVQNDIAKARKESDRYSGGLIKVLAEVKAATLENSLAFITQRELLLKYDIPFYAIVPQSDAAEKDKKFKATPGHDIDKF